MLISLACLAVAMTGTAALLSWIDPSQPVPLDDKYIAQLGQLAHTAVIDGVDLRARQWSTIDIQVLDGATTTTSGMFLAAGTSSGAWHFRVGRDGRAIRAAAWSKQQNISDPPGTICIQLPGSAGEDGFTVAQRFGVRALVDSLRHALSDERTRVTISMPAKSNTRSDQRT